MNKAQRVVLVIGVALLLFEILFPPFKWTAGGKTWAAKHSFILTPPEALDLTFGTTPATVDAARWVAHGVTLVLVTALALLLFRSWNQSPPEADGKRQASNE
jgi:hypothetical protein